MRRNPLIAIAALLCAAVAAYGDIIGTDVTDDGDHAIELGTWSWAWDDANATGTVDIPLDQFWGPGHSFVDFTTDTDEDPHAWIVKRVKNCTDFDWTDYHYTIWRDKPFSIVDAIPPPDWTYEITAPTQQAPGEPWIGAVDFDYGGPGTEIEIGERATFRFKVSFFGFLHSAHFCLEQYPTPEPGSLGLLALGALVLLRRR